MKQPADSPRSSKSTSLPLVGIDVGGTKIAASLVSEEGTILAFHRQPTVVSDPEATLDGIAHAARELLARNQVDIHQVPAIGFGIPGLVDPEKGIGIASVNLGWQNVPVRAGLEARLGVPCVIDNDVRTGAVGEAVFGAARGLDHLVYLNIGTGISAVILNNGKFFMGVKGLAGEIGHAVLVPDGPPCKCGGRGCFEAVASGPAFVARAQEKISHGRESSLTARSSTPTQALLAEDVFAAAAQGDRVAVETVEEIGALMAYSLQYLALAYDPDILVIGGSVVQGSQILFHYIQGRLQQLADESWVFRKVYTPNLVKLSSLGNNTGVLGAAALVKISHLGRTTGL